MCQRPVVNIICEVFSRHHKALDVDRAYPFLLLMPLPKPTLIISAEKIVKWLQKKCNVDFDY